jgi:hypothetical protein
MCPACIASTVWMAGSVMSTGGVAALAVKMVRGEFRGGSHGKKSESQDNSNDLMERRNDNVNNDSEQDGTGSGGAAR